MGTPSPEMTPIGHVRTDPGPAGGLPNQASGAPGATGRVEVRPELVDALLGLVAYRHIWLLTWLHDQPPPGQRPLQLVPAAREAGGRLQGVFASRAPVRPNPLGLSLVRNLGVEANVVTFGGVDLLDGTPVLDIKPWFADCDLPTVQDSDVEVVVPAVARYRARAWGMTTTASAQEPLNMSHIDLSNDLPGIVGLLAYRPETAGPLSALAETLLRTDNSLARGEREAIAAYVSFLNECTFCERSHSAFAARQLSGGYDVVESIKRNPHEAPVSPRLRALLEIAASVQRSGRDVTEAGIATAHAAGASDVEIHDTVLIAAAFCMYNRYVDGLGTWAPDAREAYDEMAEVIVAVGYEGVPGPTTDASG
jgi:tRNA-Thr(GGU) m(6)t(6)A37 methyltransferase TsaA